MYENDSCLLCAVPDFSSLPPTPLDYDVWCECAHPRLVVSLTASVPMLWLQERRDDALSRADYLERLAKDLKEYYGFLRELVDMFLVVS